MQLIEGIMLYLTRPLWDYTLGVSHGGARGRADVVIETIASVSTDGGAVATVTPCIEVRLRYMNLQPYKTRYDWVSKYVGVPSKLKYWRDLVDGRQDPWGVLRQAVQDYVRHGGGAGVVTKHLTSKEELVVGVRDALAQVTHAMLYYRTTHDREAFKVLTPRLSPWTYISEITDGYGVTQENVHKLVTFNREGGRRWVEGMVGNMLNVKEVRCSWDPSSGG